MFLIYLLKLINNNFEKYIMYYMFSKKYLNILINNFHGFTNHFLKNTIFNKKLFLIL